MIYIDDAWCKSSIASWFESILFPMSTIFESMSRIVVSDVASCIS